MHVIQGYKNWRVDKGKVRPRRGREGPEGE